MRALKWVVSAFVVVGLALGAGYLWMSRDHAATHPALRGADLPPLIPISHFWADRKVEWAYRPSVGGRYIAYSATRGTQQVVVVETVAGRDEKTVLRDVDAYYWHDLEPLLHAYVQGRLWRIDPENPARENWTDVTPRGFSNWHVANRVRSADEPWVVASRDRNPAFADVYTTRQDGGGKELLLENEGRTLDWVLDAQNRPLIRLDRLEDDRVRVLVLDAPDTGAWRELLVVEPSDQFWIHEADRAGGFALVTSSLGRDRSAVVRLDLSDGSEEVLAEDPRVDLFQIYNLDPRDGELDLVQSASETRPLIALSETGETLIRLIGTHGDRVHIDGMHWAGTGRFVTAALSPDAKGYLHVLFDLEQETSTLLGAESFRERHLDKLADTVNVSFPARDGLNIPALLLRGPGRDAPGPLVVEVHGGPSAHVEWQHDQFRQFLVNRGYSVLSVNFRGSTGYGRSFKSAGYGAFGRAMQTDLYDAAAWAVEQGIADPEAIAILGASYGGYAAGMAATEQDSPFAAAVIEHAVLDVEYQMRNNPFAWGLNDVMIRKYFGSLDVEEDVAAMRTFSPINRVDAMRIPALVIAGKRDRIVGFEQSEEFLARADAAGKRAEGVIFEEAAHGFSRWQDRIRRGRRIEQFLARHLGGRDGGWDVIELVAKHVD